jgi:quinol-cytochrome oxidoreductase complex cytochrome b subunit
MAGRMFTKFGMGVMPLPVTPDWYFLNFLHTLIQWTLELAILKGHVKE